MLRKQIFKSASIFIDYFTFSINYYSSILQLKEKGYPQILLLQFYKRYYLFYNSCFAFKWLNHCELNIIYYYWYYDTLLHVYKSIVYYRSYIVDIKYWYILWFKYQYRQAEEMIPIIILDSLFIDLILRIYIHRCWLDKHSL